MRRFKIKNNRYAAHMDLKGLIKSGHLKPFEGSISFEVDDIPPTAFQILTGMKLDDALVGQILMLVASAEPGPDFLTDFYALGTPDTIRANLYAALYQDDDAHDTCSLTACLNPLHPGPCKGWKGTLHSVSPGAWKALESARVEKANAARVKKIQALKAQGKPIPHKLLQPIVAKQHPDAGKTANAATGEAHDASKAISEASGVHVNEPGKVTLGQAVKAMGPVQKGPKGKKPTLASKGIAFVISQPKVTDQYKLDKAAAITGEQWTGLSGADKATIKNELAKIEKDGFGPQQKKATDLLGKFNDIDTAKAKVDAQEAKIQAVKEMHEPGAPKKLKNVSDQWGVKSQSKPGGNVEVATKVGLPSGYMVTKDSMGWSLKHKGKFIRASSTKEALVEYAKEHDAKLKAVEAEVAAKATPPVVQPMTEVPKLGDGVPGKAKKSVFTVVHEGKTYTRTSASEYTHASLVKQGPNGPTVVWGFHKSEANALGTPLTASQKESGFKVVGALPVTKHENMKAALDAMEVKPSGGPSAPAGTAPGPDVHSMTPVNLGKLIHKQGGSADIMIGGKKITVGFEGGNHEAKLTFTPGLSSGTGHYTVTTKDGEKYQIGKGESVQVLPQAPSAPPAAPEPKLPAAEKPKPLPAHVQHAIDMATGTALGASWSKNHLTAYQPLSGDEFDALPKDVQDKIVSELHKATTKFLDPKKVVATKALLAKFGHGDGTTPAPKVAEAPKIVGKDIGFSKDLHNHAITPAQAKDVVEKTPIHALFLLAKQAANVDSLENPDSAKLQTGAVDEANNLVNLKTSIYDKTITDHPDVVAAKNVFYMAAMKQAYAEKVADAKQKAFNKVNLASKKDGLSPIQKAGLVQYGKYLLKHNAPQTDTATIDKLKADTKQAGDELNAQLADALKQANAPAPKDMSPVQLNDAAKDLMGLGADKPEVNLTQDELKTALALGKDAATAEALKYPPEVLEAPGMKLKLDQLATAAGQLEATKAGQKKLEDHLDKYHVATMTEGADVNGSPLTSADEKVIAAHQTQILVNHKYLTTAEKAGKEKLLTAKAAFHAAAEAAEKNLKPAEPLKLTPFDEATIPQTYENAWFKHADKAVTYGVKTQAQAQEMTAHPDFPAMKQGLHGLTTLAGELALATAKAHTAKLNVPVDPDTDAMTPGPEKLAWLDAGIKRDKLAKEFDGLHKKTQGQLDTIRASVGLKKRALPKANAPAVLAAAAETGHYKSGGYSGPNYGKPTSSKNYMLAKLGPQHAVVHQSLSEKKLAKSEKLGDAAGKAPSTAKIENGPSVKLGGDSSIADIPAPVKKEITSTFKGMPKGKYLADPPEDIFTNLVNLAAGYGKSVPDGLSVDQVLKTIDETHSKNMGFENTGALHKKITDWLGTADGKAYAESHSTADPKIIKQITGEVELPKGVVLEPGQKVQQLGGPGKYDKSLDAKVFHPFTASQAQAEQDAYMKAQGIKWTPGQKKGMTAYTGNGPAAYDGINNYLRGEGYYDQVVKQYAVDIQSAMMPLRKHTLLKRGTGWPPALEQYASNPQALLNHTFEDKGFVSSTVAGSSGHFSGKPLQLTIEAPEGTPAAFVNGISQYKGSENEMLLASGLKYKVLSVEVKGHQTFMRVRVVGTKTHEEGF